MSTRHVQYQIALVEYVGDKPVLLAHVCGPVFPESLLWTNDQSPPLREVLASCQSLAFAVARDALERRMITLPSTTSGTARYLTVAREMLNRIEGGKSRGRCVAYEQDGIRHLLIAEEPPDEKG